MHALLEPYEKWMKTFLQAHNPAHGMVQRPVYVSHGDHGLGPVYMATLHHPPQWLLEEALEGNTDPRESGQQPSHPEGRKIAIRTEMDGEPHAFYIQPHTHGLHMITRGAGRRLNGLFLTGLHSDAEYAHMGRQRRALLNAHKRQMAKVVAMQNQSLQRQAELAGQKVVSPATHLLDMTPEQAQKYAEMKFYHGRAQAGAERGEPDMYALRRLAPNEFLNATPEAHGNLVEMLHNTLDYHLQNAHDNILYGHPQGAHARWLKDYLDANRHDPAVVVVQNPQARQMLYNRLGEAGHKVASFGEDGVGDAIRFAPPSGRPDAHVLLAESSAQVPPSRRHHLIWYDTQPDLEPDPQQHKTFHVLQPDIATH